MGDVTRILEAIDSGDPAVGEDLLPLVYDELRRLAAAKLAQERPGQTLQATALVHEAYVRLVDVERVSSWNSRGHFFSAAAEAMRRILIETARHKQTIKAGGQLGARVELSGIASETGLPDFDLFALDEALERFSLAHSRKAELVKLRFFAGLTHQQAAEALGISTTTADNDWAYAKAWLRVEMSV